MRGLQVWGWLMTGCWWSSGRRYRNEKFPGTRNARTGRKDLDGIWCSPAGGAWPTGGRSSWPLFSLPNTHTLYCPSPLSCCLVTRTLAASSLPKELLRNLRSPRLGSHQPAFIQQTSAEPPLCSIGTGQAQGAPHSLVSGSMRHQWPVWWPLPGDKQALNGVTEGRKRKGKERQRERPLALSGISSTPAGTPCAARVSQGRG